MHAGVFSKSSAYCIDVDDGLEDYNAAHIELYKVDEKGAVDKIVESKRGDLRMMSRVEIED